MSYAVRLWPWNVLSQATTLISQGVASTSWSILRTWDWFGVYTRVEIDGWEFPRTLILHYSSRLKRYQVVSSLLPDWLAVASLLPTSSRLANNNPCGCSILMQTLLPSQLISVQHILFSLTFLGRRTPHSTASLWRERAFRAQVC